MTNSTKYQTFGALIPVITAFISGSYIQNYFSHIGVSLGDIGTFTSLVSVVQIVVMIINVFAIDRIKRLSVMLVSLIGLSSLGCALVVPVCFSNSIDAGVIFIYVALIALVINIFMGLYNVLSFKFAYYAVDMSDYAKITNNISIVNGILAIAVGFMVSLASGIWDFSYVMGCGLSLCVIIGVVCIFMIAAIKPIAQTNIIEETKKEKFSFSMLKEREFTYFYIPNFIRGLAMSAINVIPLIFIKNISADSGDVSMLVNIMSVSAIAGCFLYRLCDRKIKTSAVYFVSSTVMFVFMPLLLAGYSVHMFYLSYFILGIFYNINAVSAAVHPSEFVPFERIGTYTSVRLIILTVGQALGAYVIGLLIDKVPSIIILVVCAFLQLVSGVAFLKFKNRFG